MQKPVINPAFYAFLRPLRLNERAGKTFIVCKVNEADDNN